MPESIKKCDTNDFMDPYSLAQLADETGFYAESISSLRKKFESIFEYSSKKFQIPNIEKTKSCHFSSSPLNKHSTTINPLEMLV